MNLFTSNSGSVRYSGDTTDYVDYSIEVSNDVWLSTSLSDSVSSSFERSEVGLSSVTLLIFWELLLSIVCIVMDSLMLLVELVLLIEVLVISISTEVSLVFLGIRSSL
jgi:hypothetical protein